MPDPIAEPDDQTDATNRGVSAPEPAEGADDTPAGSPGSPHE